MDACASPLDSPLPSDALLTWIARNTRGRNKEQVFHTNLLIGIVPFVRAAAHFCSLVKRTHRYKPS
jgi:hypothetical protein